MATLAKYFANRRLELALAVLATLTILSSAGFGVYYYYDRFVHPDESIADRQIKQLEEAVRANPQNPDIRVGVASYYAEKGLTDKAIQQIQEALRIDTNHQGAIVLLGGIYAQKGETDKALSQFSRVVELNKDNPMAGLDPRLELALYQMGNLYIQQGKYAKAVESLKQALSIDRADADALYSLGIAYQKQSDHANAITSLQQALRFVPDFIEAYQALAVSYAAMGKNDETAYAQAMVTLGQGKYADAAKSLEGVIGRAPSLKQAYLGLGLSYEKLGRREKALAALQEYLATYPNDIAAQQALGRLGQVK
jgi:tetratricopeptide (TPR) repeat protein